MQTVRFFVLFYLPQPLPVAYKNEEDFRVLSQLQTYLQDIVEIMRNPDITGIKNHKFVLPAFLLNPKV